MSFNQFKQIILKHQIKPIKPIKPFSNYQIRSIHQSSFSFNKSLTEELKKLTQTHQTQSNLHHSNNLGPFRIPKESIKSNSIDHLRWNQLNWNQTFKRSFLTLRNLLIVGIGTSIGTLVIYSILSELFAPSSTTNLIISITQTISTSTSLHQILIPPHLFHTSTSSKQILSSSNDHLPQHLEIRLMIEGSKSYPEIQTDYLTLGFYQTLLKRYLSPLITSKIKEDSLEDQMKRKEERMKQKESKEMESMKDGWKDWIKSVLANLMITQTKENPKKRLNWIQSQRPSLGEYQTGEVIAEIIKDVRGEWKYKSLVIDFPNSNQPQYRLDVLNELRRSSKSKREVEVKEAEGGLHRFRVWHRKIQI